MCVLHINVCIPLPLFGLLSQQSMCIYGPCYMAVVESVVVQYTPISVCPNSGFLTMYTGFIIATFSFVLSSPG